MRIAVAVACAVGVLAVYFQNIGKNYHQISRIVTFYSLTGWPRDSQILRGKQGANTYFFRYN